MRVLIVCAAPLAGSPELVASLATDADLVIAVDGGGAVCQDAGVVPGVVLGDFDSLAAEVVAEFSREGVEVVRFPADKDATDLELAIEYARAAGASTIVVTAATSGRLDHTLGVMAALWAARDLRPRIAEPDMDGWLLAKGSREAVALSGPGAVVSLVPGDGTAEVSALGVRWPLDHARLGPGTTLGISNVVVDATSARFRIHEGVVLVIAPRVGGPIATEVG